MNKTDWDEKIILLSMIFLPFIQIERKIEIYTLWNLMFVLTDRTKK